MKLIMIDIGGVTTFSSTLHRDRNAYQYQYPTQLYVMDSRYFICIITRERHVLPRVHLFFFMRGSTRKIFDLQMSGHMGFSQRICPFEQDTYLSSGVCHLLLIREYTNLTRA